MSKERLCEIEYSDYHDESGRIAKREYSDGSVEEFQYDGQNADPCQITQRTSKGDVIEVRAIEYDEDGNATKDVTRDAQGKPVAFEITNYANGYINTIQRMLPGPTHILETDRYIHDFKQGAVVDIEKDEREIDEEEIAHIVQ